MQCQAYQESLYSHETYLKSSEQGYWGNVKLFVQSGQGSRVLSAEAMKRRQGQAAGINRALERP